ncbi:hypothetical protein EV130_10123 [Rhizobium azibense]|uniref:Uncharacterized protein n=1 Tax=Rhizobium azibense TaxID=1136135 RepID=A0A4R3RB08_9HYPH|nr:hypothetical protein EV130_10123 [Rhizobium azibense]
MRSKAGQRKRKLVRTKDRAGSDGLVERGSEYTHHRGVGTAHHATESSLSLG